MKVSYIYVTVRKKSGKHRGKYRETPGKVWGIVYSPYSPVMIWYEAYNFGSFSGFGWGNLYLFLIICKCHLFSGILTDLDCP